MFDGVGGSQKATKGMTQQNELFQVHLLPPRFNGCDELPLSLQRVTCKLWSRTAAKT